MKRLLAFLAALTCVLLHAQVPQNIQKLGSNLTADFTIPSGRTVTVASGGSLVVASGGTFTGAIGTGTPSTGAFTTMSANGLGLGGGTGASAVPLVIGGFGAVNSVNPQLVISQNFTGSGVFPTDDGHAFSDSSNVSRTGGVAYTSYDGRITTSGAGNFNHIAGFQSLPDFEGNGTITSGYSFVGGGTIGAGTVTNLYGLYEFDWTGAGAIGTHYGVYIPSLSKASTNWGVYVASNASYFGGAVTVNGNAQVMVSANVVSSRSAGTAYNLTGSFVVATFGTTNPVITIPAAGTWDITYQALTGDASLTTTTSGQAVYELYRSNNTPAVLGEMIGRSYIPVVTADSSYGDTTTGHAIYTTANANDTITVRAGTNSVTVTGGNLQAQDIQIAAERLY